jgi:phage-related protein
MRRNPPGDEKPLHWMGSSKRDLLEFPETVIDNIGYALGAVQFGGHPPSAKPWKGLGPGVSEIVEDDAAGTFRAVYTVRFRKAIYVLHAFQKKSPSGIRTARRDVELIGERLKAAKQDYEARYGKEAD